MMMKPLKELPGERSNRGSSRMVHTKLLLALTAIALLLASLALASSAGAEASSSIEGIWSFNGGEVAIQPAPGEPGTLEGVVVAPTTFAECPHNDGEPMWTKMKLQSDGSYWGFHQWFYEKASCAPNKTLGETAWRVLEANGSRYLEVCFSSPEDPSQPMIAANGTVTGDTYGCVKSNTKFVAALPTTGGGSSGTSGKSGSSGVESFKNTVLLPSAQQCLSRRSFKIHFTDPKYDPIKTVVITLGKRRIVVRRHHNVFAATIDLKGLPAGTFTIKIQVTTVLGHHLSGSRTYHTCARKAKRHRPGALKALHSHHG
jgi:hypothetical protein